MIYSKHGGIYSVMDFNFAGHLPQHEIHGRVKEMKAGDGVCQFRGFAEDRGIIKDDAAQWTLGNGQMG